jgi:rubrerythrin
MENVSKDVVQIIKEAIKLEINGRSFFEFAAETTQNELGKKMFTKLANDEIEHLRVFGDLFSAVIGGDDWKKFVSEQQQGVSTIIESLKSRVRESKSSSDIEAISIGMELEKKAIDFFDKSARDTSDIKTGEICRKISEEEKFHYDLLQAQHDSLTNSGFWMDSSQFKMDGQY